MLAVASCPIIKCPLLDLADQLRRLRPFPLPGVTMLLRAADPPALSWQAVRLADDQHRKLRLPALLRFVVHKTEDLAQGAHLGPREIVAEQPKHFRISDRYPRLRRGDQDRAHLRRIGEQPGPIVHPCGCCATGVSSNTSSFDVLCGHGITSRHRNGPMRSTTPAMSRLGSSP